MDYLVPANAKKSMLIAGFLRPMPDLLILGVGATITLCLLLFVDTSRIWITVLSIVPALIAVVLILPIPNYHNSLVAIGCIIKFYTGRRKYFWKGWCSLDEFKD